MPKLFDSISLRSLKLDNRIIVSPMCQYSATEGKANNWHLVHLGQLALSGAGCVIIEATAASKIGRISKGCLGLYNDENEKALGNVLNGIREISNAPIGIQLGHAGRKSSASTPWEGGAPLTETKGSWPTVGPSAIPFSHNWHVPFMLDRAGMQKIIEEFITATRRAQKLKFDLIELHAAHGYLLSQFLSPLANKRTDEYGGNMLNRMRFPLEVVNAIRNVWPKNKPMGVRINALDWEKGGIEIEDSLNFAHSLKNIGIDYICVSSGGNSHHAKIPVKPGYQVSFAEKIRKSTSIPTMAVGLITTAKQANTIVNSDAADMVAIARAMLNDPRWVWHAADTLGIKIKVSPQYARARPETWPGYTLP